MYGRFGKESTSDSNGHRRRINGDIFCVSSDCSRSPGSISENIRSPEEYRDTSDSGIHRRRTGLMVISFCSVVGSMIIGGAIGCAVSFHGDVARMALSGALIGLFVGFTIVYVLKFITRTRDDSDEMKTVRIKDDDLKNWFEAGLLREIIKKEESAAYCMGEMFYIILPYKQFKLDPKGNKYCIVISPKDLKKYADHETDPWDFNLKSLKELNSRDLLYLMNDHNLQEIAKAKIKMNQKGLQFLPENIDYELEQRILAKRYVEREINK